MSWFYYCDYADKRTLFPSAVFSTLARQILEKVPEIPESIASMIERASHDGDRLTDHSKALAILQKSIESISQPLYPVLDGLDECTEHSQKIICSGLRELLHHANPTTKLYITSRSELDTSLDLNPFIKMSSILVSPSAIALDIEPYIRASTKQLVANGSLVLRDPTLEDLIVHRLVKGAKGM